MTLQELAPKPGDDLIGAPDALGGSATGYLRHAALAVFLAWLAIVWAWPGAVFFLTFDDSFYYLEIARNLAAGDGPTFDRINPTNGFHPLWLALVAPAFAFGLDGLDAVRVLLTVQLGLWFGALCLVAGLIAPPRAASAGDRHRGALAQALVLAVVAGNPYVVKTFVNGMESAVYLACYAILLWQSCRIGGRWLGATSRSTRLAMAVVASYAFLARSDAGLVILALGCWCLPEAYRMGARGLVRLAELFVMPAAVIVLFLWVNGVVFDSPLQVSGELKRLPLSASGLMIFAACAALPALGIWRLKARAGRRGGPAGVAFPRLAGLLGSSGWFAVACGLLVGYYVGLQAFPRLWYFGPVVFYGLVLLLAGAADLAESVLGEAQPRARLRLLNGVLIAPLVVMLAVEAWRAADPRTVSIRIADQAAGEWISGNLPADAVVGSWDAGVVAYFARQRVINLDGFVNSTAYARALNDGTAGALLNDQGLAYLVNHDVIEDGEATTLPAMAAGLLGADRAAGLTLLKVFPFTFAGSANRLPRGVHEMATFVYELSMPAPEMRERRQPDAPPDDIPTVIF